jgi:hypothetical protein
VQLLYWFIGLNALAFHPKVVKNPKHLACRFREIYVIKPPGNNSAPLGRAESSRADFLGRWRMNEPRCCFLSALN